MAAEGAPTATPPAQGFRARGAGGRTPPSGRERRHLVHKSFIFNTESTGMRLACLRGVMKLLCHRATRHFIALLIECRCGRKFLHRLDRPAIACLHCGRTDGLGRIIEKLRAAREAERRRAPRAARRSRTHAA